MIRGAASERGFTLIEALVALAIGGFVIATIATITGQWMRSWRFALPTLQRAEMLVAGLDRVVADLSAARFMPASLEGRGLIFSGEATAVTLVRRSLAVERPAGLEIVRLAPQAGHDEVTLARSRSPLAMGTFPTAPADVAPVALLRPPYAIRFAYADADRRWRTTWHEDARLPRLIRVEVVDRRTGGGVLPAVEVSVHIEAPLLCATVASAGRFCDALMGLGAGAPPAGVPAQTAARLP